MNLAEWMTAHLAHEWSEPLFHADGEECRCRVDNAVRRAEMLEKLVVEITGYYHTPKVDAVLDELRNHAKDKA